MGPRPRARRSPLISRSRNIGPDTPMNAFQTRRLATRPTFGETGPIGGPHGAVGTSIGNRLPTATLLPIERAIGTDTVANVGWVTTTSAPSNASTTDALA